MIVTKRWKYGCPKGHIQIRTLRRGKHAGQIFCKSCMDWYPAKVLRKNHDAAELSKASAHTHDTHNTHTHDTHLKRENTQERVNECVCVSDGFREFE